MNVYQQLSTVLALVLYLPLSWQILRGQVKQNLATWLLWALLDGVAAASLYVQGGNWYLPAAFVAGATLTLVSMVKARTFCWTILETITSMMVVVCIIGWYLSGPRLATILSTTGVALATIPQFKDAYRSPNEMPFLIYVGSVIANSLATAGGQSWTVEERLYPATCIVLTAVISALSARKFLHSQAHQVL